MREMRWSYLDLLACPLDHYRRILDLIPEWHNVPTPAF